MWKKTQAAWESIFTSLTTHTTVIKIQAAEQTDFEYAAGTPQYWVSFDWIPHNNKALDKNHSDSCLCGLLHLA